MPGEGPPATPEGGQGPASSGAPEIIVEIFRQRSVLAEQGLKPAQVALSRADYDLIQEYRKELGALASDRPDYLGRYRVFDLEVVVGDGQSPLVLVADDPLPD